MTDPVIQLRKYIGRDYATYNCFDLVKEFYKDQFQLDLKEYFEGDVPERKEVESLIISNKGKFISVSDKPVFGDIVVIKFYGVECHIGVVIGGGKFLHSARGIGSLLDKLDRYSNMIAGYFRHRERP